MAQSGYPVIHRVTGKFMQLPRDHVNAFIVELEKSSVVIDTTLALSSAKNLRKRAEALGKPIDAVLLTHGHPDHYTGLAVFGDMPRYGSQGCLEFAQSEDKVKAQTATGYLGDDYPKSRLFPNKMVKDGNVLEFGGVSFKFLDFGPGESDSDGAWVIEREGVKNILVGDLVARNCHSFFRDGHFFEWMAILDRIEKDFPKNTILHIGHGESPTGMDMIAWQKGYNNAFLAAVKSLKGTADPAGKDAQEKVVAAVRKYLPSEATLFLLLYELGTTIEELQRKI